MATAIDPICKMRVDTGNPPGGKSEYQGATYYFCAPGCRTAFEQDPGKYLSGQAKGVSHHGAPPQPKPSFFTRLFGPKS